MQYKQNAKETIDEIFAKIDKLQEKANKFQGEAKVKYDEKLAEIRSKKKDNVSGSGIS